MIEAERTPGFLHLLQMTGGASWLHMCIHHRETEGFLERDRPGQADRRSDGL
jgi:zinc transporter